MGSWADGWVGWALGAVAFLAVLQVVIWLSHRSLRNSHRDGTASAGGADAFGGLIEVFEPGRARADKDLESAKHQGQIIPSPGTHDDPVRVDLRSGKVQIRRPRPEPPADDVTPRE